MYIPVFDRDEVIQELADQTKLPALNATIESARVPARQDEALQSLRVL